MRPSRRIALQATVGVAAVLLGAFFAVLFLQGTTTPLVLAVMVVGIVGTGLMTLHRYEKGDPLWAVVIGTVAMLAGVLVVPSYLLAADRPGVALACSAGLSAVSVASRAVSIWVEGRRYQDLFVEEPWYRRLKRRWRLSRLGSLSPVDRSSDPYVGRVPPSARYLGAVVPTAALELVPRVGSAVVGSPVVVTGIFVLAGVAAYGVQALTLWWLGGAPVRRSLLEDIATKARAAAAIEDTQLHGVSRRAELLDLLRTRLYHDDPILARDAWREFEAELRRIKDRDSAYSRGEGARDAAAEVLRRSSSVLALITHPFRSVATVGSCVAAARELGVVLDAVWPRIQLVLAADQRRTIARGEAAVAGYRLVAASGTITFLVLAVGAAITATPVLLWPGGAAAGIAVLATAAGRRKLADAYERRLAVTRVRRFDLANALRIEPPETTTDLVRMGDILYQGEPPGGRPVRQERSDQPVVALGDEHLARLGRDLAERLPARITEELATELRQQVERLASEAVRVDIDPAALGDLARQVVAPVDSSLQERMRQLERSLLENVREAVERSVVGEPLSPFAGFLVVQLEDVTDHKDVAEESGRVAARAGAELSLMLSVLDDPRGRSAAPERGRQSDNILAVQPVHIPGDAPARAVDFELVVDSPSLTPSPHRASVRIQPGGGNTTRISFALPEVPGEHEAWIQLYQSGRLVEVVSVPIDVTGPAPVAG